MPILAYNFTWMLYNSLLAVIAVLFGLQFLSAKKRFVKLLFGVLWLLFLPNTIYIVTDMIHLFRQWDYFDLLGKVVLLTQYIILQIVGFVTYIYALQPFEYLLKVVHFKKTQKIISLVAFNFLIAFGMVLGRIERVNSWDVFLMPDQVLQSAIISLTSFTHLGLFLLLGLFCNFFYFLFRNPIYRIVTYCKNW